MMPLFVAQHQHRPETCPVSGDGGAVLLAHVSAANAARYGVAIQAEAMMDGEHRFIFVVEAADREAVERFLAFLHCFGDLLVLSASTAEQALDRGGCAAAKHGVQEASRIAQTRSSYVMSNRFGQRPE